MKATILFLMLVLSIEAEAQYAVHSPYLQNPELAIPYVDSCAQFWIRAYDSTYGGFYTNVDKFGNLISSAGSYKNLVSQSRDAYGFTRAYMLTGNETYLLMARSALNFLYQHAWDDARDGWYSTLGRTGTPSSPNENKTAFDQHYALLGITTSFEATRDTTDWRWLMRGYASNETHLWEANPTYYGYFDYGSANWQTRLNKSFNATVDAVTTHVLYLYLLTGDDVYRTRLLQLADNMMNRIVPTVDQMAIGFVEAYNSNWEYTNNTSNYNTRTIMGHVLKTAWCLGRIHQLLPDTSYVHAADKLINNVWTKGYDHVYGGPYKDYDRVSGQMILYGVTDSAKAWWQMEQAVVAGLMQYDITGNEQHLQMADETIDFFMRYFVDHVNSEVFADRGRRGARVANWDENKGSSGKAAYHSIETGYYTYLYGNLIYKKAPATLHYKFKADTSERTLRMNPVALATTKYRIKEVRHDGVLYTNYNAGERLLVLPAGVGGHFTVTYEPTSPNSIASSNPIPAQFELQQNYPNPFNPTTIIRFSVPRSTFVSLKVFNLIGKEVATLEQRNIEQGNHTVRWNAQGMPSGVYFYRYVAGDFVQTKKMVLMK